MKILNNLKLRIKLIGGFCFIVLLLVFVSVYSMLNIQTINHGMDTMYTDNLVPITQLDSVNRTFLDLRGDCYRYLLLESQRTETLTTIEERNTSVTDGIAAYKTSTNNTEMQNLLAQFDTAWEAFLQAEDKYIRLVDARSEDAAIASLNEGGELLVARQSVSGVLSQLTDLNTSLADQTQLQGDETFTKVLSVLITITLFSILIAIGLGIILTNSLTRPLDILVTASRNIAIGDLLREMTQKDKETVMVRDDEIGDIGKAFHELVGYIQNMGEAADTIARKDLTLSVTPRSERDELGIAFGHMLSSLREIVSSVTDNAASLSTAAQQLSVAANQADEATNQIAVTIQQIAKGTQDQTTSVTKTAASIEQLSSAIRGVANGAQDQSQSVSKASDVTNDINQSIQQVADSIATVTVNATEASDAARKGSGTVEETLDGMRSIKSKVDISAERVKDMGKRSEEIGMIVATIEEIASQTNLLALNAAIEAARAGEHGKGFAVVADEVRKLAERSATATKEIGELINRVLETVAEAVAAMQEGQAEVESGVISANAAGSALSEILNAVEIVNKQAALAADASQRMKLASEQLVDAMDSVSAVVEENTASTEEMSANSGEITLTIENIASVSEENSAAVEEVSAGAEEMSAQVGEVTSAADSLLNMAQSLKTLVEQFAL